MSASVCKFPTTACAASPRHYHQQAKGELSDEELANIEQHYADLQAHYPVDKALAHGLVGGITALLGGGDFIQGALAAGMTEVAARKLKDELPNNPVLRNLAASLVGGALGGKQGALIAATADKFNRQLHQTEYDLAKQLAARKDIRDKLSKMEGYDVTEEELLGRIIREINRNVDYETAKVDGGVADWNLRALVGCEILQCSLDNGVPVGSQDPNYYNMLYNQALIEPNLDAYAAGLVYSKIGLTADDLKIKNIQENPTSAYLVGTQLMAWGLATSNYEAVTTAQLLMGAAVGGGANAVGQYAFTGDVRLGEVALAATTGGLSFGQSLPTLLLLNEGNAMVTSTAYGDNPNTSLLVTPAAVAVGYGVGSGVDRWVYSQTLKAFADGKTAVNLLPGESISGSYGVSRQVSASELVVPSLLGTMFGGAVTEGINREGNQALSK